ncbi:MAG TPA: head GIN domain-containing protein [Pedobacter sp.]|uniref:head GIN domain-containing protein n=1 Tax=Pedobacter sp. TaxID=1411316 RepID=UPI002CF1CB09|nr:head GIN domain-containing protein [Pedobacter sp.]HMI04723.1 head GIN domain-containing protein [Pedobacter sp.]
MRILTATALLSIFLTSCSKDKLTASGEKTTETRALSAFTGVDTDGSSDIHIACGTEFKVTLSGSNNLIPYFKTEVVGSTLHLGYKNVNVRRDDVQVYVTLPAINYLSINGSGDIGLSGQFPALDRFEVSISGSGEVEAEQIIVANEASVKISGSGEADLKKLQSKNAEVHISGSGDAKVSVSEKLKARISGSGELYYLGSPQIDSQISGSGKLIKL